MPRLPQEKNRCNPVMLEHQVEVAMALQKIDKHILSSKMDMPIRTLNHKLTSGYWTYEELFNMFRILKMPNEYILMIFGR